MRQMKKLLVFSVLLLAAMSGCKKEAVTETAAQPETGTTGGITVIAASAPEQTTSGAQASATRIALGGDGDNYNVVTWTLTPTPDVLMVFPVLTGGGIDVNNDRAFKLQSVDATGKKGTFALTGGQPLVAGTKYIAYHLTGTPTGKIYHYSGPPSFVGYTTPGQLQSGGSGDFSQTTANLLLYAPPVEVANTGDAPAFTFRHTMSMIEFDITAPTQSYLSKITISGAGNYFVNDLTMDENGFRPSVYPRSFISNPVSNTAMLNFPGTDLLGSSVFKARLLTAWNPAATPSGDFTITLTDTNGKQYSCTKPAKELKAGVIYRTAVTPGVLINGVVWAMCNVDAFGTFAASPEAAGMFYQWNRIEAWPATGGILGWDSSTPAGDLWEAANDPCPAGWHVPTDAQQATLLDASKVSFVWTTLNGVKGGKFTDITSGNSIFLPAAGLRSTFYGTLTNAGNYAYYWSSSSYSGINSWAGDLNFDYLSSVASLFGYDRSAGLTVRCIFQ